MKTTLILRTGKPRNPWVAAAFRSGAGAHRRSNSGQRQQAQRAVQHELREHDKHRRTS